MLPRALNLVLHGKNMAGYSIPHGICTLFNWKPKFSWCQLCRHWWHRNLRCHQWRRSWHHDDSRFLLFVVFYFVLLWLCIQFLEFVFDPFPPNHLRLFHGYWANHEVPVGSLIWIKSTDIWPQKTKQNKTKHVHTFLGCTEQPRKHMVSFE